MASSKADHKVIEFTSAASADVSGWARLNALPDHGPQRVGPDGNGVRPHRCVRLAVTTGNTTADQTATIGFALTDGSEVYEYAEATATCVDSARRTGMDNSSGQYFASVVFPDRHGGTDTFDLNGGHKSKDPENGLHWRVGLVAEDLTTGPSSDNPVTAHFFFDEEV